MCGPGTAIAAALSAGGAYLQTRRTASNERAMQQARESQANAEMVRQNGFQDQAAPIQDKSVAANTREAQDVALKDLQAQRANATASNVSDASAYAPATSGNAPAVVNTEIARRMSEAVGKARAQAREMGALNAWGNLGTQNAINFNQSGQELNTINRNSRGSMALLPYEQNAAANNANKGPSQFAALLQLGGAGLGLANGLGAFNPATASATSPAALANIPVGTVANQPLAFYVP